MQIGMVSALCVLALLICSTRPAAAQSNPASLQTPPAFLQNVPPSAKLSDLPKGAESGSVEFRTEVSSPLRNGLGFEKKFLFLNDQQQLTNGLGMQAPVETSPCGHILVYRAPAVDSKMIIEVPTGSTGDKPKLEGMQACREDFRTAVMVPPARPVAPWRIVPLGQKLDMLSDRIRP